MDFGADTWWLFGLLATACIGVISYFLKRTMSKQDEHEKAINKIKRTYVNKDELKELKSDINKSLEKLQQDVDNIKENSLTKREFFANTKQN